MIGFDSLSTTNKDVKGVPCNPLNSRWPGSLITY